MARMYTEGWESQSLVGLTMVGGSSAIVSGRIGGYALSMNNNSSGYILLPKTVGEFYFKFSFHRTNNSSSTYVNFRDGSNEILQIVSTSYGSNAVSIYSGATLLGTCPDITLANGVYVTIFGYCKIADAGGRIVIKAENGVTQIDFTGDTKPGTGTTIDRIFLQASNATGGLALRVDDFAINDTVGTSDISYPNDFHLYGIIPNANGDVSQLSNTSGTSVNNYLYVDDGAPDSDTSYVESSTGGLYDLYNFQTITVSPGSQIDGILVEAFAKEVTAGGNTLSIGIKSGGVENWGTGTFTMTTAYAIYKNRWNKNPSSSGTWVQTDVDSLQAGVKT